MVYELGIDYLKLRSGASIDVHDYEQRIVTLLGTLNYVEFTKGPYTYTVDGYKDHMCLSNGDDINFESGWVMYMDDSGPIRIRTGIGTLVEFQKKIDILGKLVGFPIKYKME